MQETEYYKIIDEFLIEHFLFGEKHNLQGDSSLMENGIIDSTGALEMVNFLEERFNITVETDEFIPENLDSIDNICAFLDSKVTCAE